MTLGQVLCTTLLTLNRKVVRKPTTLVINQYLKVLKPILGDQFPTMIGYPYDLRPTRANILLVDDNPSKNILNPTFNCIMCPMRMIGKVQEWILMDLVRYFQVIVGSRLQIIPQFVRNNQ